MTRARQREIIEQLSIETARALLPHAIILAPALTMAIDRATDAMMIEGSLSDASIEAIHDFGHFLVRAAEEMFAARSGSGAGPER